MFGNSYGVCTACASIALAFAVSAGDAVGAETYSLVHAIGNSENVAAKGLTKAECETRKSELKKVAEALGTYNERTGRGSITCLPDSLYN